MPIVLSEGNCRYTPINGTSTATATTATSTATVNPGPGAPGQGVASPQTPGAFYGLLAVAMGTFTATGTGTGANSIVAAYDVVVGPNGTSSNLLCSGTMSGVGAIVSPTGGVPALGVRYNGSLVVTLNGASNSTVNALWD
jgi:hypothetical protein